MNYYTGTCTSFVSNTASIELDLSANPGLRDGQWHQVSGTVTGLPVAATSARVLLSAGCVACITGSGVTTLSSFDDIVLDAAATPVTFRSLQAARSGAGVVVRWRTASELHTLGFHVYREVNGRRVRITQRLVSAKGQGRYSYLDDRAPRGKLLRYWIQELGLDGSRRWHGPARS